MSPEQVRGLPADHRADLFALGAVLYEMLSGRRAFERSSSADTMSAILRDDPPELEGTGRLIPPAAERIVRHCLEKNPEERFRSAYDLAFDLEALSGSSPGSGVAAVTPSAARSPLARWLWPAAVALALVAGVLAGALFRRGPHSEGPIHYRLTQLTERGGAEQFPALSPQGDSFVFERMDGGDRDLFLQRVGGQNPTNLTADCDKGDRGAAFSPDGRFIAYHSECGGGGLYIMGATGESPRRVADFGFDPAFSPDGGEIVVSTQGPSVPFGRGDFAQLWAIRLDSGAKRLVTRHDAVKPTWSPSGRRIAFWGLKGQSAQRDLWSVAADGSDAQREPVSLLDDAALDWWPVWAPDGASIYFLSDRGGTMALWRLPVDETTGRPRGEPSAAAATPAPFVAGFSLAADGKRIALAAQASTSTVWLAAFDPTQAKVVGEPAVIYRGSRPIFDAAISPDGQMLAFSLVGEHEDLYTIRSDGSALRQLTDDPYRQRGIAWLPDGSRIVFQSDRNGRYDLWTMEPGGGAPSLLATSPTAAALESVFRSDGRRLAMNDQSSKAWLVELRSTAPQNVLQELPAYPGGALFRPADFSPDGRQLLGVVGASSPTGPLVVFDIAGRSYRRLELEAGGRPRYLGDAAHLVFMAPGGLQVADLGSGTSRFVLSSPRPGAYRMVSLSADKKWLAWIEDAQESDIWLATMEPTGEH